MNRRNFLRTTAGTAGLLLTAPAWRTEAQPAKPSDDEILAQTKDRIEKHRKGDGVIVVRDQQGKTVPGATVKIEQLRHDFLFGSNFFMFGRVRDAEREEHYRQRFAALLNYATLGFYWGAYERERGKPNYDYTDKVVAWCREQSIPCKGHPLAWDHPASSPRWLTDDLKEVEQLSTGRVREIIARFKGRIDMWDVVNEPSDLTRFKNPMNTWAKQLGAVPFTRLHLDVARAANPQATLLVNDYRTDPLFSQILDALRDDRGKLLFDALGIQSHMHGGGWPLHRVWEVCDTYAKFGVPIHFTETTIVSGPRLGPGENWGPTNAEGEAKQADYVPKFYTALFAHPAMQALTWWDFADDGGWQGAAAGWLRKDMSPKPVYDRLASLIKGEWWTKVEGRTDAKGERAARAFFGTQRITAKLPNGHSVAKEVHWERGKANKFELSVG
ncbi:MAG: endo-1,4-beta-xylanase [Verrucomicrobia bacterium]|nr:endo-1,4-beta-xylanase [Verrucomicrobiota bacterium]